MYACPDCKNPLNNLSCSNCGVLFETRQGIPELFSRDSRFAAARDIGAKYDDIYTHRTDVWGDQGRTPEFIAYFSQTAAALSTGKLLEIGCGEGFLLTALRASDKTAIDISAKALEKAQQKTQAQCAIALAER